ncbi:MAG: hypothetical protein ACXU8S_08710 [Phenylobacterium sp.]
MYRTYELYVRGRDGRVEFRPLTHRGSLSEVMSHVRGLVDETDADAIEVRAGGEVLFQVGSSR